MISHPSSARRLRRHVALLAAGAASVALALVAPNTAVAAPAGADQVPAGLNPIDPQNWENPQDMTWDDYQAVPGVNWDDPSLVPSQRTFRAALVLGDYPGQPFIATQPVGSDPLGSPSEEAHDIPRSEVAAFYRDFLNKPEPLNHGHTLSGYWMEDSGGRFGVSLDSFGPYLMPGKLHEYGLNEFAEQRWCPAGDTCNKNLRTDLNSLWTADVGSTVSKGYDFIIYLSAGHDESSTWQEFGEMRFTQDTVPEEFGNPDPAQPNWSGTRYVPWTSWKAASYIWPNAQPGVDSVQAESSGLGTFAHEFSHILGIGDNYNNPYGIPLHRSFSGPWEMLSRGTFNGPGGPHNRWDIPATQGGSMGVHHMLRNKLKLGIVDPQAVVSTDRNSLARSGVIVATVTARSSVAGSGGLSGIKVTLPGGDRSPACDFDGSYLCDGGGYDNYTLEIVDRRGYDSFVPDAGVLLAKNKDRDLAPFTWVVDAHQEDIGLVDFTRPDGTPAAVSLGDFRQLSDSLFHAGTRSGSSYEFQDTANRLHFYVIDVKRTSQGVLTYRVAIRSLDGSGPHVRGVSLRERGVSGVTPGRIAMCTFQLSNTGRTRTIPDKALAPYVRSDVYRLAATASGRGWTVTLPTEIQDVAAGSSVRVPVFVERSAGAADRTRVTLRAQSESGPVSAQSTCSVSQRDTA